MQKAKPTIQKAKFGLQVKIDIPHAQFPLCFSTSADQKRTFGGVIFIPLPLPSVLCLYDLTGTSTGPAPNSDGWRALQESQDRAKGTILHLKVMDGNVA